MGKEREPMKKHTNRPLKFGHERYFPRGTEEEEAMYSFDALPDLEALARVQGISPVRDIGDLAGDWPEGESVEDFIAAATEGRYEEEDTSDG